MNQSPKIKSQKEIVSTANKFKKNGKKIVTFNGSFDLLHIGHILSVKEAKSLGDILIVLLNSDKSVQSYKSAKRPIIDEKDRAETLASLEAVDFVVLFNEVNSKSILEKIKPDIHCNGADWGKNCVERAVVEKNGGKIHILHWQKGLSTSKLIAKILQIYQNPPDKAIFIEKKLLPHTASVKNFLIIPCTLAKSVETQNSNFMAKAQSKTISLNDSWIVGEHEDFIVAGRDVNAKTIKIGSKLNPNLKLQPHYYAKDIKTAFQIIKNHGQ